jgi:hypothetical protein
VTPVGYEQGTNYVYDGPVGVGADHITLWRHCIFRNLRFAGDLAIACELTARKGDVLVIGCQFDGHVKHDPRVRFEYCLFMRGKTVSVEPVASQIASRVETWLYVAWSWLGTRLWSWSRRRVFGRDLDRRLAAHEWWDWVIIEGRGRDPQQGANNVIYGCTIRSAFPPVGIVVEPR